MFCELICALLATLAAIIDLRTRRIPNLLTYGALVFGLALHFWLDRLTGLGGSVVAALVVGVPFLPLVLRGGMGGGDLKLALSLGAIAGKLDDAVFLLLSTSLAGLALALVAAARAKRFFGVPLAYGPAFAVGAWALVFWREVGR